MNAQAKLVAGVNKFVMNVKLILINNNTLINRELVTMSLNINYFVF